MKNFKLLGFLFLIVIPLILQLIGYLFSFTEGMFFHVIFQYNTYNIPFIIIFFTVFKIFKAEPYWKSFFKVILIPVIYLIVIAVLNVIILFFFLPGGEYAYLGPGLQIQVTLIGFVVSIILSLLIFITKLAKSRKEKKYSLLKGGLSGAFIGAFIILVFVSAGLIFSSNIIPDSLVFLIMVIFSGGCSYIPGCRILANIILSVIIIILFFISGVVIEYIRNKE